VCVVAGLHCLSLTGPDYEFVTAVDWVSRGGIKGGEMFAYAALALCNDMFGRPESLPLTTRSIRAAASAGKRATWR